MRRISRDNVIKKTARILGANDGASLLLVSVIAIIVLTAVVVLRITTSTFMASSNKQLNQDQAYELAASLGESIDILIERGEFSLDGKGEDFFVKDSGFVGLPSNTEVTASVETKDDVQKLIVYAKVGNAEYYYTKEYRK